MAFTQSDIDSLKAALATGVSEATVEGRRVVYRSTSEILTAIARAEAEVAAAAGAPDVTRLNVYASGRW